AGDVDTGVNEGQNTPVIDAFDWIDGDLVVTYHIDSDPANQAYPLQVVFYASDSDGEEGQTLVGIDAYAEADHGGCGTPPCAKSVDLGPFVGLGLVATATDADGNTSEFSVTSALPAAEKTVSVVGGGVARPGGLLLYTIQVANDGTGPARAVVVTDSPDAHTALVPDSGTASGDAGAIFSYEGGVLTATLDRPLPGLGATLELTFLAEIDPALGAGTHILCNQGSVEAERLPPSLTDDPNLPGDADATCVTVESAVDLALSQDDGGVTAVRGGSIPYELIYRNHGTADATGVVLTEVVPAHTTFDAAADTAGWSCAPDTGAGSTCTLAIGTVAAGAEPASATFAVLVDAALPAGTEEILNTASIADDGANGPDSDPGDNIAAVTTAVDLPPIVLAVDTVASTPDGSLTSGEMVLVPVTQLYIAFSEEVSGADETTSFLVVEAGGDQGISTQSCVDGPQGDDVSVPIAEVSYDNRTARLHLSTGKALARGLYRVLACGTAIRDASLQPLDGNVDGAIGDDFRRDFRIAHTGLLDNPNFDQALAPWSSLDFDGSTEDVDGVPTSGSAEVLFPVGLRVLEHPCISVTGQSSFLASLAIRISDPSAASHQAGLTLDFFSGIDCSGSLLGMGLVARTQGDTAGQWTSIHGSLPAPSGAESARPSLFVSTGSSSPSEVLLDRVQLIPMIFGDGFESGNTSAWSTTIP
ncbi:MAG: hypothetical protein MI919_25695, partial [Holophagales bacterium]|nr:hypothetical protein [Holophagales bacterium]